MGVICLQSKGREETRNSHPLFSPVNPAAAWGGEKEFGPSKWPARSVEHLPLKKKERKMLKRRIGRGNERQTNHFPSFATVCTKAEKDTSDWQRGIEEVPRQFSNASWKSASPRSRVLALKWGGEGGRGRGEAAAAARYYTAIGGRLQSPSSSVSSSSHFFFLFPLLFAIFRSSQDFSPPRSPFP